MHGLVQQKSSVGIYIVCVHTFIEYVFGYANIIFCEQHLVSKLPLICSTRRDVLFARPSAKMCAVLLVMLKPSPNETRGWLGERESGICTYMHAYVDKHRPWINHCLSFYTQSPVVAYVKRGHAGSHDRVAQLHQTPKRRQASKQSLKTNPYIVEIETFVQYNKTDWTHTTNAAL